MSRVAELILVSVQPHLHITDQAVGKELRKLEALHARLARDITDESLPPRSIGVAPISESVMR